MALPEPPAQPRPRGQLRWWRDLATCDSSDPSHAFLFPGLARRTEVGFVATLTLESEPIQAEDGDDRELEVLRVPVFGNEGGGTRAKPIISHGCNCDRG